MSILTCMSVMAQIDVHIGNFVEARAFLAKADAAGDDQAAHSSAFIYELVVKMDLNIAIFGSNKASQEAMRPRPPRPPC
jgi:hypothetical protein